jgi:ABC-type multidrug transport system fused ATPase/permease subunit
MWAMSIVAENLTFRLRRMLFSKMLRMHVGWHDLPSNKPGALASTLSNDAQTVNSMVSTNIGIYL